ncbi:DUF411 domain-containing protein [Hyphomicrobium sp.]|uniref:DUF411 domain-containing protein n=1 Tax=Hyphomicrobium sp. TaxID=82 RepID=UPI001E0B7EB6|nr:DUF411 domain-containing protein [Hyphomicrobium sp.]MBY0560086.1 DUF411 domain-containing protein [Hyphomicrobium sp.]
MKPEGYHYERRAILGLIASAVATLATSVRAESAPTIKVFKDADCNCCGAWVEHLRAHGFVATITETSEMQAVKARSGVPKALSSCHTAEIAGYVVEGHVPAHAIQRLLAENPQAIGLAVSGMPIGSPGMEGGRPVAYDVILFEQDRQDVFGRYKADRPV